MNSALLLKNQRIPALDLLRVLAILILMVYHHLMMFVPEWGFHFKVDTQWYWLQNIMLLPSPWRMGLLWFISGVALCFMLQSMTLSHALVKRSAQLLFPLLIGILVVVPPQLYVEMKQAGQMPLDYMQFWYALLFSQRDYFINFRAGIWPSIDVNHLWFLRSLWQFSLLATLLQTICKLALTQRFLNAMSGRIWFLLVILCVLTYWFETQFDGDPVRELYGLSWFLTGFLFARFTSFWQTLSGRVKPILLLAVVSLFALQLGYIFIWKDPSSSPAMMHLAEAIYVLNKSVLPVAVVASVYTWYNRPIPLIQMANSWVYPLYIIHQTVSIVVTYALVNSPTVQKMGLPLLLAISGLSMCVICGLFIALVQSNNPLRLCFGIRLKQLSKQTQNRITWVVFCLCLPLGYEILV